MHASVPFRESSHVLQYLHQLYFTTPHWHVRACVPDNFLCVFACACVGVCTQVLLSGDDLKMMMDEVTIERGNYSSDGGPATVNLRTFLLIMEHSAW